MNLLKKKILICLALLLPQLAFTQYHVESPGTDACFEKVKQSPVVIEAIKKIGYKPADIKMTYISSRDYACYGKNILRCDGDIYRAFVYLTSPTDKEGVYYRTVCVVYYNRINNYCNLLPTFELESINLSPFQVYGKKATITNESEAKEILKNGLSIKPSIIRLNPLPAGEYEIVKFEDIKYDQIPSTCTRRENNDNLNLIEKSASTIDGQILAFTATVTLAQFNNRKDLILKLQKNRIFINLTLDNKNQPKEILIEELNCEDFPDGGSTMPIFSGDYDSPYDTLLNNLTDHGIDAVWEKTSQAAIPFSSKLFTSKLFNEMKVQLKLLSADNTKNKEILLNYVDEKVLDQWLSCFDAATKKKLTIVVEPDENDKSFFISYKNKKGERKGFSSFGFGSDYSYENGKMVRELKCQIN
jgi:hypothetical protein